MASIRRYIGKIIRYDYKAYFQYIKWKNKLRKKGKNLIYGRDIKINAPNCLSIGNNVSIRNNVCFTIGVKDKLNGGIFIGNGCRINKWCDFGCENKIEIGDNCIFGPFVHITDRNHEYRDVSLPIKEQGIFSKGPVIIGSGSWFGFRSQVMSGVNIGKNCVIAAGAIVTKDVPDYCVVAGNPAKIIRRYNFETNKWEKPKN